ncbi:nitrous oxide reductase accessory protein NosL [Thalassospira sp. A3_1]|uniref:nitrous oxide reductase accessory protein NosL n=1 Tax=Thalassospira sp. A3_1 TaxID=2821088 RepID=UPI001AD9BFB1|nr:nitrous oxide reductase accessory protein NosL [Thalassospira sp. A3_1]MBO9509373.1 nitrous oxide reductase accessory protein NosL [Thalassospira sp. A3_1]
MITRSKHASWLLIAGSLLILTGCQDQITDDMPPPVALTEEAVGHFCQMNILEHAGPKAQIHLDGLPYPLFFSQVRDGVAYERMPEQNYKIRAVYVTDMSKASEWNNVGPDNWIPAISAYYVVGSNKSGGMGSAELVPFSGQEDAMTFARQHGGRVMMLTDISDALVLGNASAAPSARVNETATLPDDEDYRSRLEKLRTE